MLPVNSQRLLIIIERTFRLSDGLVNNAEIVKGDGNRGC